MISDEKETIAMMIRLYCRRKEHNHQLCPQCDALIRYAVTRLDYCRFGDGKPSCRLCPVHCYSPEMARRIRVVMRWAGPRMLFFHPRRALLHLWREMR